MNPHTPHPDEGPTVPGGPDDASDTTPETPAGSTSPDGFEATGTMPTPAPGGTGDGPGATAGDAPPLYPPRGPYPSYSGSTPPPAAPTPAAGQNFFDWIRSHGIHRGRERWIGGVASGIAQRLGVDPLIVRGILIVLTVFAGVGVLLYGLAWALLPEPDGRIHVQEAAAGRWSTGMTGALITTLMGFPSLGGGVWGWDRYGFGAFVWTVFWVGGAIYAIYYLTQRNKTRAAATPPGSGTPGTPPSGTGRTSPVAAGSTADAGYASVPTTDGGYHPATATAGGYQPVPAPAGGSYTPPPSGGYRPAATAPRPAPKPRNLGPGTPAVAVTAGLALLVGGGIKALDAAGIIFLGGATDAVAWASGVAVLGLGILVSGLRGRTGGILGFFAVVALIIGGVFNLAPYAERARFQNIDWAPASIEQARDGFEMTGATGTVDLTKLNLTAPLASDVVVRLDVTASNVVIAIPATVPVQLEADMTMGNLNDSRGNHGGITTQENDYNTDKPGARLVVKVSGTLSNITVREGN